MYKPEVYPSPRNPRWTACTSLGRPYWVYAVQVTRLNLIKIGFSVCLRPRLHDIKARYRSSIEVLGVQSGAWREEAKVHGLLAESNARSEGHGVEFFYPTLQVLDYIRTHMGSPEDLEVGSLPAPEYKIRPPHVSSKRLSPERVHDLCDWVLRDEVSREYRSQKLDELCRRLVRAASAGQDVAALRRLAWYRLGDDLTGSTEQLRERLGIAIVRERLGEVAL